mmetsp:Transcript_45641/g.67329  ORF Transcript_45641/g.67329 Transcript_45641/m.67329 type:complete len:161 (+) Transcript_45641:73-555(+)
MISETIISNENPPICNVNEKHPVQLNLSQDLENDPCHRHNGDAATADNDSTCVILSNTGDKKNCVEDKDDEKHIDDTLVDDNEEFQDCCDEDYFDYRDDASEILNQDFLMQRFSWGESVGGGGTKNGRQEKFGRSRGPSIYTSRQTRIRARQAAARYHGF